MTARPRFGWSFALVASAFVLVVAAIHGIRLVEPLGVDQGLFACFARWVPRGWLPYRDIFDSKPPLFLYTYALAALAPGGDVLRGIGWMDGAFLAGSLVTTYVVGKRLWGPWAGLACAAALFLGLWSPAWGGFWSRAQAEELLALPMIASAWFAWRAIERHPLATVAGVLAGICGLYKIPSMAIGGAWIAAWLLTLPRPAALRRIALLACGAVVPWILAGLWFAAHHAFGDFVEGVFVYHRYNAAFIAPPWFQVLRDFVVTMATRAPVLLVAAAAGIHDLARRRARELRWLGPWIAFTMLAIVLQRQLAEYHYLLAMPALAFAAGHGVASLGQRVVEDEGRPRRIAAAVLVAIAAFLVRDVTTWAHAYGPDALATVGRLPRDAYLRTIQPGSFSMATEEEAARYVRARTAPGDGILVWGLSPGIYALADRHPVTRYPFHKILMTDAPLSRMWPGLDDRRARFIEKLGADPPAYVLVGRGDVNGFEPEDSMSSMRGFAPLREILERDYTQETTIGRFVVFHRSAAARDGATAGGAPPADPLAGVHLATVAVDWNRPLPVTPPGGVAGSGYVGSAACDPCHSTIETSFARHSMARSGLRPLASLDAHWLASVFDAGASTWITHPRSGLSYRPRREGDRYFIDEALRAPDGSTVSTWTEPLTMSLSAGSYGMSFYFKQGNRYYQAPIDYYAKLARWDVDAGAAAGGDFRFSKALATSCISCHSDYPHRLAGSDEVFLDPMPAGVGCERCHGPGARHAKTGRAEDIVDPGRLSPELQLDACAQCHESDHFGLRAGHDDFSYRPGQSLAAAQTSWVAQPPEPDRFILLAHPERMVASACYRKSGGKLTCTSCHDPHVSSIEEPPAYWDTKCNACHDQHPCTESPQARAAVNDHCVTCHMRQGPTSNLPLVSVTDHWIQRRPPPIRPGRSGRPAGMALFSSLAGEAANGDDLTALEAMAWVAEGARDDAARLAARVVASRPDVPAFFEWLGRRLDERGDRVGAASAFATVLARDPDSRKALLGYAHEATDAAESMRALDRALAIDGEDGAALEAKALALVRAGRGDEARPFFEHAASVSPWTSVSHVALAAYALRARDRAAAIPELEAARRVEPGDAWVLDRLIESYRATGDSAQADATMRSGHQLAEMGRRPSVSEASQWLPPAWR